MSRCLTWACSCSAMRWCWRGGMCVTHLSRRLTGAHTRSWPLWLWPAWLSERSHTHAVSFYLLKKYNKYWIWTVFSVWWLKVTVSSFSVDVSHAFVLEGPCRSWVCATERGEERDHFLSVLRSAITSALTGDQWRHRGDASARQEEVWTPLLLCVIIKGNVRFLTNQQDAILFPVSKTDEPKLNTIHLAVRHPPSPPERLLVSQCILVVVALFLEHKFHKSVCSTDISMTRPSVQQ